jgi:Protein of unknown function (DUF1353)
MLLPATAVAQFAGNLRLAPKGCEVTGQCTLQEPLRFKDATGLVWEAMAGLVTDGASIPGIFQPLIGGPFDEKFIKAAVVHDHYCDRHVRSWRKTHRVFYEALLDQGVSVAKAKTMYLAVVVGGPKWIKLIPGNKCGNDCVNTMKSMSGIVGYRSRRADYSTPALPKALQEAYLKLQANPDSLSLEQLDSLAQQLRPNDFYFANGDEIEVSSPYITE